MWLGATYYRYARVRFDLENWNMLNLVFEQLRDSSNVQQLLNSLDRTSWYHSGNRQDGISEHRTRSK